MSEARGWLRCFKRTVASTVSTTASISEELSTESAASRAETRACFHCGEPCPEDSHSSEGRIFCCQGCLFVHDLLAESGLGHFYDLNSHPGVRVRPAHGAEEYAYLEAPAVQEQLLDFTDGKLSRVTFHIPGIHCVACVWLLENLFHLRSGIGQSRVNFARREVAISFAPAEIRLSEIVALLDSLGYAPGLTLGRLEKSSPYAQRKTQWLKVGIAGFAFGNIMLFSLPLYLGLDSFSAPVFRMVFGALSLVLALPVLLYSASDYWKSALLSLRTRVLTLDVPIALGLAALYAQSTWEILSGAGEGYLDSLAGLVFFLLCGRAFQQKTHDRILFDLDYKAFFPLAILRRNPNSAALTSSPSEPFSSVPISQLEVGDELRLRNGELLPADATLLSGSASIDYSFVTGESAPVVRVAGEHLYAGGKQVGESIEVRTVKPVSQSYLSSLWMHEAFTKERNDIVRTLTNRYSRRFTWAVIAIAVAAALFWVVSGDSPRGIKAFTSVLIVACPCALALAAPFTLGTAQRLLSRRQVFLKDSYALERMAVVDNVVFDKTGTLTLPWGSEVQFLSEQPLTDDERRLAASLAAHSTHPLSVALREWLNVKDERAEVLGFQETPGKGIQGEVEGRQVRMGAAQWVAGTQVKSEVRSPKCEVRSAKSEVTQTDLGTPAHLNLVGEEKVHGGMAPEAPPSSSASVCTSDFGLRTSDFPALRISDFCGDVCLSIDERFRGSFRLQHRIRPEVNELLPALNRRFQTTLLSGDGERDRPLFAPLFNAGLHFSQQPVEKLEFIRSLQEGGKTVLMVGDGLNDAGALKQSDIGVAVVERAGSFSPASDVILPAAELGRLDAVLRLARSAVKIVRLSFGISALYNAVGISISAAGVLSPLICAVLMPLSSVSVVLFACAATRRAARKADLLN